MLFLALWQSLISFGFAPTTLLPPPGAVFGKLAKDFFNGDFLHDIAATLIRLFAGFGIAVVVGVFIGLAAAVSPAINAVVKPLVRVLAPIPKIALYPALLLILGFDHASKITLVTADALFPILLSTYYGASMVEQKLIWSAMAAGTPRWQILFKVVLPAAMPSILTGCRIGLVISCIVVFLAEMITSTGRPRSHAGAGRAHVPDRGHVRAADHDLAARPDPEQPAALAAQLSAARLSGSVSQLSW